MKKKYTTNTTAEKIHIGEIIKKYIDDHKIFKSVVARRMQRDDSTILQFQKGGTMQTAVLIEFCYALKHNFFRDIADRLPPEFSIDAVPDTKDAERIAALELEITVLMAEREVLIRAMRG